jgi:hypothetical protein
MEIPAPAHVRAHQTISPLGSIEAEHVQPTKQPVIDKAHPSSSPRNPSVHGALAAAKPKPQQDEGTPPPHHLSPALCFRTFLTFYPPVNFAARGAVARGGPPPFDLPPGPRHRVPSRTPPRPILFVEAQAWPRASSARAGIQVQAGVQEYSRHRW